MTFGANTSNGTLDLAGYSQSVTGLAVASSAIAANQTITASTGSSTLFFTGGTSTSAFPGTIQDTASTSGGTLGLRVSNGTLDLSGGATTYAGATTVNSGLLIVNNLPNTSAINVNGGTFGALGQIGSNAPISVASSAAATFSGTNLSLGAVSNSGNVSFTSTSGTVTLANLSGSGPTTFSAGAVFPTLSTGMGLVTVAGPAAITTASGGTANLNGAGSSIGTLTNSVVNLGSSASVNLSAGTQATGTIAGSGSVSVSGPVTFLATATNSYSGGTTINNGGLLTVPGAPELPAGTVTVNAGGAVNFTPTSETFRNLSGRNFVIAGSGANGNGAIQVNVATSTAFADMQIGNVTLAGDATIGTFGGVYLNGQQSGIHFGESGGAAGVINLNGFTLTIAGDAQTSAELYNTNVITGTGNIVVNSGNLQLRFSQNWNSGTITMNPGGTINSTGANSLVAPLVLNGGTLSSFSSQFTLSGSATLQGNVTLSNSNYGLVGTGITMTGNISGTGGM